MRIKIVTKIKRDFQLGETRIRITTLGIDFYQHVKMWHTFDALTNMSAAGIAI